MRVSFLWRMIFVFQVFFPDVIEKVEHSLNKGESDVVTLYSPSAERDEFGSISTYDILRGQSEAGYKTNPLLPSNNFIHAIDGRGYTGNLCLALDRKSDYKSA